MSFLPIAYRQRRRVHYGANRADITMAKSILWHSSLKPCPEHAIAFRLDDRHALDHA